LNRLRREGTSPILVRRGSEKLRELVKLPEFLLFGWREEEYLIT